MLISLTYIPSRHMSPTMPKVQIWGYRCERCGHEWVPRDKAQDPKVCPHCKSPYWDRPRQADVKKPTKRTQKGG
jgi:predicted Zn-ribbon and HTH transcriptional regulator